MSKANKMAKRKYHHQNKRRKVEKTVKPIVSSVRSWFWSLVSNVKVMRLYFVKEAARVGFTGNVRD